MNAGIMAGSINPPEYGVYNGDITKTDFYCIIFAIILMIFVLFTLIFNANK